MKKDGWIKLHREILKSKYWLAEPFTKGQAWVDINLLANHSGKSFYVRGIEVHVKRGQLGWSTVQLATRWKWSRGKVGRFLGMLKNDLEIEQQNNKITTIITILNYESDQGSDTTDSTTDRATDGQQTEQQTVHKQECKESKNVKNKEKIQKKTVKPYLKDEDYQNILDSPENLQELANKTDWHVEGIKYSVQKIKDHCFNGKAKYKDVPATIRSWNLKKQYEEDNNHGPDPSAPFGREKATGRALTKGEVDYSEERERERNKNL